MQQSNTPSTHSNEPLKNQTPTPHLIPLLNLKIQARYQINLYKNGSIYIFIKLTSSTVLPQAQHDTKPINTPVFTIVLAQDFSHYPREGQPGDECVETLLVVPDFLQCHSARPEPMLAGGGVV